MLRGAVGTARVRMTFAVAAVFAVAAPGIASPRAQGGSAAQAKGARRRSTSKLLQLDSLDAYLEFRGGFSFHEVKSKLRQRGGEARGVRQRNEEWSFEERLGLSLGGWLVDPGFITFQGEFSLGLGQDRFREDSFRFNRTDRDRGYLVHYDLRLNFLPGKRLSGSLYALRADDRINRRFQPTLNQRRTGFGTSWVFAHDKFPMELSYDYLDLDRTGNSDRSDDEHTTESTLRYRADWLISDRQRLQFSYEHGNTKQNYQGLEQAFETARDLFILEHQLDFDEAGDTNLRTRVHWQEESGDFARDLFEIGPQLTVKHSDQLQTSYKYQFNRERFEGLDVETQRLDFQLVHQKYTNLTTAFDAFALYEDVENDINTVQYGASVDWQYNRRNRFGHLYANLALAYDTEEVEGDNGRRIILDEAHTLRDPIPVTLRNRNVIRESVIVTDSGNRRVLRAGIDYLVIQIGNATRLQRLRTGLIADGDAVLVDYLIRTPANGQLDTIRVDFSLEQRFKNGTTPYYRLSYRNQEDDTSTGFLRRADRTDHHRLGVNHDVDRYSVGAEYEIFDDTVDPFDAFHVNGLWHVYRGTDHTVDVSTRLSRLFFEGGVDRRNVTLLDLALDHRRRLSEALSAVERVGFRFEDDSVDGITRAWDLSAGLEYAMGDLSGELMLEYDRLDLPQSEENNFGVFVRLRRELPNVLRRR